MYLVYIAINTFLIVILANFITDKINKKKKNKYNYNKTIKIENPTDMHITYKPDGTKAITITSDEKIRHINNITNLEFQTTANGNLHMSVIDNQEG